MSLIDILGVGEYTLPAGIDASRLDLVAEFMARPIGRHGNDLQLTLSRMRSDRAIGRYVLVRGDPGYWLAECPSERGEPYRRIGLFATRDDAERFAFALRWRLHTGNALAGFPTSSNP